MTSAVAVHDVSAPATARRALALLRVVALLVCMLAVAPAVAAADQPTPDPSLDVRPDPAPARSQTASARDGAGQAGRSPSTVTRVVVAGPSTTAQATSGQAAGKRSTPVPTSTRRTPATARATGPHPPEQRLAGASAIATLHRLSPLVAAPQWLRPAAGPISSRDDAGAQLLLLAAVALLLFVATSASLIRLTTRTSGGVGRESGR